MGTIATPVHFKNKKYSRIFIQNTMNHDRRISGKLFIADVFVTEKQSTWCTVQWQSNTSTCVVRICEQAVR